MNYRFKYRRRIFWRQVEVSGHRYDQALDKMVLYFQDGGIREVAQWSRCEARLGPDWVLAVKKDMEAKAGQAVPVNHAQ